MLQFLEVKSAAAIEIELVKKTVTALMRDMGERRRTVIVSHLARQGGSGDADVSKARTSLYSTLAIPATSASLS